MRGFFGIGVECVSKSMNVSGLFRTAHAFGASFVFTVDAQYRHQEGNKVDTSATTNHGPFYCFPDPQSLVLPNRCKLVGIELYDRMISLGKFPRRPVGSGKPPEKLPEHKFGDPILRKKMASFQRATPQIELKEYLKVADNK